MSEHAQSDCGSCQCIWRRSGQDKGTAMISVNRGFNQDPGICLRNAWDITIELSGMLLGQECECECERGLVKVLIFCKLCDNCMFCRSVYCVCVALPLKPLPLLSLLSLQEWEKSPAQTQKCVLIHTTLLASHMFVRDVPVPQPLVSAAVAAEAAAGAVGSGGGQTGGHLVEVCPMQGAASWGWIWAEIPPLKPDKRKRIQLRHMLTEYANRIKYYYILDHCLKQWKVWLIIKLKQHFHNELFKVGKVSNINNNAKWSDYKNFNSKLIRLKLVLS